MVIVDVFAHKAAVQAVEESYFEGHPILFRDVELRLAQTTKSGSRTSAVPVWQARSKDQSIFANDFLHGWQ
jgi:hypothetical protein